MRFDVWLARRVAPDRHYPHFYTLHQRRRRPLPDETNAIPSPQDDARSREAPSEAQRRFDRLPGLTQDAYILFETYGRSVDEISKRLGIGRRNAARRSEEHTSELQSLMRTSYAVFCWKKTTNKTQ